MIHVMSHKSRDPYLSAAQVRCRAESPQPLTAHADTAPVGADGELQGQGAS